ncbi:hypothetical protein QJS04_geneDACA023186 [Acorus gramineus]|uniref:Uncharacterized protein n=1 Tax=Acorus gramineus TaxID=55184 RepID=A0AAV9BX43_ACOGR|nr:hypothetical protein QJS04_geneDACA023186 [Acorus gramineus]
MQMVIRRELQLVYCQEQILAMEATVLSKIERCMIVPTPYMFLAMCIKAAMADKEVLLMLLKLTVREMGRLQRSPCMVQSHFLHFQAVGLKASWLG